MLDLTFWMPVIVGGAVAGGSTAMLGYYVVGMRIPFLGVCVSHAALAGAVFGSLAGLTGPVLLLPALAGAVVTALLLGLLEPEKLSVDMNVILGVLFTLTMGLAFLGIGLFGILGRSANDIYALLWGSVTFVRWRDVALMTAVAATALAFVRIFYKEMRAIMFSRLHARAAGIHVTLVWTLFLILTSAVLTVNFQTVGGLMIYSLMANPAAAAFQLVKGYGRGLVLTIVLGVASSTGGFLISAWTDMPTGAMIVIVSSVIVAVAVLAKAAGGRWTRSKA